MRVVRSLVLVLLIVVYSSTALAASYVRTDGTIVDPIQNVTGEAWSGPSLEPFANMNGADLRGAVLRDANLRGAWFHSVRMDGTDLSGADLFDAEYLGTTTGKPFYDASTNFTNAWSGGCCVSLFDPVSAGWLLVPEPNSALLMVLGFAGLAARRRLRR